MNEDNAETLLFTNEQRATSPTNSPGVTPRTLTETQYTARYAISVPRARAHRNCSLRRYRESKLPCGVIRGYTCTRINGYTHILKPHNGYVCIGIRLGEEDSSLITTVINGTRYEGDKTIVKYESRLETTGFLTKSLPLNEIPRVSLVSPGKTLKSNLFQR